MEAKSGSKLIVCLDVIPIRCTKKQGQNDGTIVSAFAFISCLDRLSPVVALQFAPVLNSTCVNAYVEFVPQHRNQYKLVT